MAVISGTDIKIWHGKSGKELGTVDTNQLKNNMATISPNGRFLAAAAFTADVKVSFPSYWIIFPANMCGHQTKKLGCVQLAYCHLCELLLCKSWGWPNTRKKILVAFSCAWPCDTQWEWHIYPLFKYHKQLY